VDPRPINKKRPETLKQLEENSGRTLHDISIGKNF
jgi:hypothetical protein